MLREEAKKMWDKLDVFLKTCLKQTVDAVDIEYIDPDNLRMLQEFLEMYSVMRAYYEAEAEKLDRIESKLDRLLASQD